MCQIFSPQRLSWSDTDTSHNPSHNGNQSYPSTYGCCGGGPKPRSGSCCHREDRTCDMSYWNESIRKMDRHIVTYENVCVCASAKSEYKYIIAFRWILCDVIIYVLANKLGGRARSCPTGMSYFLPHKKPLFQEQLFSDRKYVSLSCIHPSPKVMADFFRHKNQHDALIQFAQFLVDLLSVC